MVGIRPATAGSMQNIGIFVLIAVWLLAACSANLIAGQESDWEALMRAGIWNI